MNFYLVKFFYVLDLPPLTKVLMQDAWTNTCAYLFANMDKVWHLKEMVPVKRNLIEKIRKLYKKELAFYAKDPANLKRNRNTPYIDLSLEEPTLTVVNSSSNVQVSSDTVVSQKDRLEDSSPAVDVNAVDNVVSKPVSRVRSKEEEDKKIEDDHGIDFSLADNPLDPGDEFSDATSNAVINSMKNDLVSISFTLVRRVLGLFLLVVCFT